MVRSVRTERIPTEDYEFSAAGNSASEYRCYGAEPEEHPPDDFIKRGSHDSMLRQDVRRAKVAL